MSFRSVLRGSAFLAGVVAFALSFGLSSQSAAAVIAVGSVNLIPPSGGGTFSTGWLVGEQVTPTADPNGYAKIDGGTALQYGTLVVGDQQNYVGQLDVAANFPASLSTKFALSSAGSISSPTVQIGRSGTGYLNVSGGAAVSTLNIQGVMSIGDQATGVGYATITDRFTTLTIGQDLIVGSLGTGQLQVLNGALVRTQTNNASHGIVIGAGPSSAGSLVTGVGTVIVDGTGSLLNSGGSLVVGGPPPSGGFSGPTARGIGTLTISNSAIVDVDNITTAQIIVGSLGRVNLAGGTLIGNAQLGTTVNGILGGSGLVRGTVNIGAAGSLAVGPGDLLKFGGATDSSVNAQVSNQGSITVDSGELQFLTPFTNNALVVSPPASAGRMSLEDGTVRFSQALTNSGVMSFARGSNNVHGQITNTGKIVVASGTVATFYDSVTNSGGGTVQVLPRGNALFLADLTFTSASALVMAAGVSDMTDTSSHLAVDGIATLGGNFTVNLGGSFTPTLGQSFNLISAAGVSGTFATTTLPTIPGGTLEFDIVYHPTSVEMLVQPVPGGSGTPTVPGDFNGNGVVDAADYTVWRDSLGRTGTGLPADADKNGTVDAADYSVWKTNFGHTASGSGAGAGSHGSALGAVPEPTTGVLAVFACGLTWWQLKRFS
jgi:T5SS/PEP-CTERM-associated repeat protein